MVWEYFFYFYILQDLIEKKIKTEKYEFLKNGQYNIISL